MITNELEEQTNIACYEWFTLLLFKGKARIHTYMSPASRERCTS